MQVLNHPFHGSIDFTLARPSTKVHLQLYAMIGILLWQKDLSGPGRRNQLNIAGISSRSYILKAQLDQEMYTFKGYGNKNAALKPFF